MVLTEQGRFGHPRSQVPGDGTEQRPRGGVRLCHRLFQITYLALAEPREQMFYHPSRDSPAATFRSDRDLPDEQHARIVGFEVPRLKCNEAPCVLCDRAGLGEMGAQKQVAVLAIDIEGRAFPDKRPDTCSVRHSGLAELDPCGMLWTRDDYASPVRMLKPGCPGLAGESAKSVPASNRPISIRSTTFSSDRAIVSCSSRGRPFKASARVP